MWFDGTVWWIMVTTELKPECCNAGLLQFNYDYNSTRSRKYDV